MKKETLLLNFLNTALGDQNRGEIDRFVADGATFCGPITGGVPVAMTEWAEFSLILRGLIGPATFKVENSVEQGDWISMRIRAEAECLATGKHLSAFDCLLVRFEGGKIFEYIAHMDYFTFFEELGLIPAGSLHACMSGQRLVWA